MDPFISHTCIHAYNPFTAPRFLALDPLLLCKCIHSNWTTLPAMSDQELEKALENASEKEKALETKPPCSEIVQAIRIVHENAVHAWTVVNAMTMTTTTRDSEALNTLIHTHVMDMIFAKTARKTQYGFI
jgi:hypothetical protein